MLPVLLLPVVVLFNVVGQRSSTTTVTSPKATLALRAPSRVRGGLLYQTRFTIVAHQELKDATLVLNEGWIDGLTVNTIEPGPVNEASRNGDLALELGHLAAGAKYVLYMDYQVNPTTVGSRTLHLELDDGEQPVASLTRHLRIWP